MGIMKLKRLFNIEKRFESVNEIAKQQLLWTLLLRRKTHEGNNN